MISVKELDEHEEKEQEKEELGRRGGGNTKSGEGIKEWALNNCM